MRNLTLSGPITGNGTMNVFAPAAATLFLSGTGTGYTGTVHLAISDPQAVPPADGALSSGMGSFSVILKTAGDVSLAPKGKMLSLN